MQKKISIFLVSSLLLWVCVSCNSEKQKLHKELVKISQTLNLRTPSMLDEYTRLDSTSVTEQNVFNYHYTILNVENPDSLFASVRPELKKTIVLQFRENSDLSFFKNRNITLHYYYRTLSGKLLDDIEITPKNYK